jgi:hypothetical protein
MEGLVHNKPYKRRTYAEHCKKALVLGMSTEHYQCWKFWLMTTRATKILGATFFRHKYLTNPSVTHYPRGFSHCCGRKSHPSPQDLHPTTSTGFHHPSPKGPLRSMHGRSPQVQQQPRHSHAQRSTHASPSGAYGISKAASHSPQHTTSMGAPHYGFSKGAWHTTHLRTLQCPKFSVPPRSVQCGPTIEHCSTSTRD